MTRPPVVGAALWSDVMTRDGSACACTGQCGRKHKDGGGRCSRREGLVVAARNLATPLSVAVTLPVAGLTTWCDRCHDAASRAAVRGAAARRAAEFETDSLF